MWGFGVVTRHLDHPTGLAMIDASSLFLLEFATNTIKRVSLVPSPSESIEHFEDVAGTAVTQASGGALNQPIFCTLAGAVLYVSNWGNRNEQEGISAFADPYIAGENALDSVGEAGSSDEYLNGTQPHSPNDVVGPRGLAFRAGLLYAWEDEHNYFGARAVPALVTYSGTAKTGFVIGFSGSEYSAPVDTFGHMQGLRVSADGNYLVWAATHAAWKRLNLATGTTETISGSTGHGVASSDNGWYYLVNRDGAVYRWHPEWGVEFIVGQDGNQNTRHLFDIDAADDGTLFCTSGDVQETGSGSFVSIYTASSDGRNELLHLRPQPPGDPQDIGGAAGGPPTVTSSRLSVHDAEFGVASIFVPRTNRQMQQVNADPDGTFSQGDLTPTGCLDVALQEQAVPLGAWSP